MKEENSYKETIHINRSKASDSTLNTSLVFLAESNQVVCPKCHKDHFSNQTARPFTTKGSCQSVFSDCKDKENSHFQVMIEYESKDSPEVKTECLWCVSEPIEAVIQIYHEKAQNSHECLNSLAENIDEYNKMAILEQLLLIYPKSSLRELLTACGNRLNDFHRMNMAGYALHVERHACSLSRHFPLDNTAAVWQQVGLMTEVILASEMPWFNTSPDFLFMIPKERRLILTRNLRNKLFSLFKYQKEEEITDFIFEIIKNTGNKWNLGILRGVLCLFLDEVSQIKALLLLVKEGLSSEMIEEKLNCEIFGEPKKYSTTNEGYRLESKEYYSRLLIPRILDFTENKEVEEETKNEIFLLFTAELADNPYIPQYLPYYENLNGICQSIPVYDLDENIRKETEIIETADRLHYTLKQALYGDLSLFDSLDGLLDTLTSLKYSLGISNSIDSPECASTLNPNQKTRLLYHTQVVNTLLITLTAVLDELYKIMKKETIEDYDLSTNYPQFEDIFSELFSIIRGLAEDSYDISMLFLANCKSLLYTHLLQESSRIQFEALFRFITNYLFSLSEDLEFKETLISLNEEIVYQICKHTYLILDNKYRIYNLNLNKKNNPNFHDILVGFLFSKFYKIENSEEEDKYSQIEDKMDKNSLKISLDYILECFVLTRIQFELFFKRKLLRKELKMFDSTEKIVSYSQINNILVDDYLSEHEKVAIMSYILVERPRFDFESGNIGVLQGIVEVEEHDKYYQFEIANKFSPLTAKFRVSLGKEKKDVFDKYLANTYDLIHSQTKVKDKIRIFSWRSAIVSQMRKELIYYNLYKDSLFTGFEAVLTDSNEVEVGTENDEDFAREISEVEKEFEITDNKNLNKQLLERKRQYLIEKHDLPERLKDFENGEKLRFEGETEMKCYIDIIKYGLFPTTSLGETVEELKFTRIMPFLAYKSEVFANKCFENLISFEEDEKIEQVLVKLEILLSLVSKDKTFKIKGNQVKTRISSLGHFFVYFYIQFNSALNLGVYKEVVDSYFTVLSRNIAFLRGLVDGNNMEVRQLFSEEQFELEDKITVSDVITVKRTKNKVTLIQVLVSCCDNFLENYHEETNTTVKSRVFLDILDLISEIIEGNSSVDTGFCSVWFNKHIKDLKKAEAFPEAIKRRIEDFYLKICFEPNITDEQRFEVYECLEVESLIKRIQELKEIPFVKAVIADGEENKVERLIKAYYSSKNVNSVEFSAAFKAFLHLKFNLEYDFREENDNQETLKIAQFLGKVTRRVEINLDNNLTETKFLDGVDSLLLTEENEETFQDHVDRSSIVAKNQDLIDYAVHFRGEIEQAKKYQSSLWGRMLSALRAKGILVACLALTLVLVYFVLVETDSNLKRLKDSVRGGFIAVLVIQMVLSVFSVFIWGFVSFRSIFNLTLMRHRLASNIEEGEETRKDRLICFIATFTSSLEPNCAGFIFVTAVLAISSESLYWTPSLQLLCFVGFSKNLSNIVRAIQLRSKQLGLISVFLVFVLLIFGILTFTYMSDYFVTGDGDPLCTSMGHCLASQLDFGFRMGGGMGDNMPIQEWNTNIFWERFFYSIIHFVLFPVIMLNIVAGVIIDTFADLREQAAQLEEDINTICVVCGKTKGDINKEEGSYEGHVRNKHNVVNYMLFIKHVMDKPREELDYLETYVRLQVEERQIEWLPSDEESLETKMEQMEERMNQRIQGLEERIKELLVEQLGKSREGLKEAVEEQSNEIESEIAKNVHILLPKELKQEDLSELLAFKQKRRRKGRI